MIQHPHAIQRLETLTTQCDRDMTEYQMAQHDMDYATQQHMRTTTLTAGQQDTNAADIRDERKQATIDDYRTHNDLRTQCRQRGFSPLYAYMYVGDMYDKSKRKRIKVMFDSGCSLVVASKQFIDSLNREVMDSNLTLQTNTSLPGATSAYGDHKNSCGIVDLGATVLNSNPHTRDSTPSMNMLLSAYVFEDLSADLILGTPVWFDWVHAISWRQAHGANSRMSSIRLVSGGGGDHIDLELIPVEGNNPIKAGQSHSRKQPTARTLNTIAQEAGTRDEIEIDLIVTDPPYQIGTHTVLIEPICQAHQSSTYVICPTYSNMTIAEDDSRRHTLLQQCLTHLLEVVCVEMPRFHVLGAKALPVGERRRGAAGGVFG